MASVEQGSTNITGLASDTNQQILISLLDNYTGRIAVDSIDSNKTYLGQAIPGSAEGSAVWQIKRIDETTGTIILFADGNDSFDNSWTNRQALTYA